MTTGHTAAAPPAKSSGYWDWTFLSWYMGAMMGIGYAWFAATPGWFMSVVYGVAGLCLAFVAGFAGGVSLGSLLGLAVSPANRSTAESFGYLIGVLALAGFCQWRSYGEYVPVLIGMLLMGWLSHAMFWDGGRPETDPKE